MLSLKKIKNRNIKAEVYLPVSKSILNRNLIIKALNQTLTAEDVQEGSTDVQLLYKALTQTEGEADFKDAGTPLRLYIAYAALKGIELTITGNERLKERPIQPLLKALEQMGAEFQFLENPYQLPLKVVKSTDSKIEEVKINGSLSSQFISALMLIGPYFDKGLNIEITGDLSSAPYVYLTQFQMELAGVGVEMDEDEEAIWINKGVYKTQGRRMLEADWSAASFIFAWVALSDSAQIFLPGLKKESPQGDSMAVFLFKDFGVHAVFRPDGLTLSKKETTAETPIFDVEDVPDMFPVLVALCAIKKAKAVFMGVGNLRHKESDRIEAMSENLKQCGVELKQVNNDTVELVYDEDFSLPNKAYQFKSFNDHRIAMALSLFAFENDIEIDEETVVKKSYPNYWLDFNAVFRAVDPGSRD
jgi:3-phosphoshikimate 1-carboxyvinyltransferase